MATSNHDSNRDPTPRRQVERRIKPAFCLGAAAANPITLEGVQ